MTGKDEYCDAKILRWSISRDKLKAQHTEKHTDMRSGSRDQELRVLASLLNRTKMINDWSTF